jgi:hypothetical protein
MRQSRLSAVDIGNPFCYPAALNPAALASGQMYIVRSPLPLTGKFDR